jgi:hypothetical protein
LRHAGGARSRSRALEGQLGLALFHAARGRQLTDAGRLIYPGLHRLKRAQRHRALERGRDGNILVIRRRPASANGCAAVALLRASDIDARSRPAWRSRISTDGVDVASG